jgi:hypothetical protein
MQIEWDHKTAVFFEFFNRIDPLRPSAGVRLQYDVVRDFRTVGRLDEAALCPQTIGGEDHEGQMILPRQITSEPFSRAGGLIAPNVACELVRNRCIHSTTNSRQAVQSRITSRT